MWRWLSRLCARPPEPLRGARPVRRQKTYRADSGYIYEYSFEGYRAAARNRNSGIQYIFSVSTDRKTSFPVSVFLNNASLRHWQQAHGRRLSSTERYAVAKLALFHAFDERAGPAAMQEEIRVRPADIDEILATLGID